MGVLSHSFHLISSYQLSFHVLLIYYSTEFLSILFFIPRSSSRRVDHISLDTFHSFLFFTHMQIFWSLNFISLLTLSLFDIVYMIITISEVYWKVDFADCCNSPMISYNLVFVELISLFFKFIVFEFLLVGIFRGVDWKLHSLIQNIFTCVMLLKLLKDTANP